jgi:hypothetical protein
MLYDALEMERRQRAPRRTGRRTTLTIPDSLHAEAERFAAEIGTTVNDALIRLAEEAAAARARRAEVDALAAVRRAAVDSVGPVDWKDFPSPEDLQAAMLSGRRD